MSNLIYIEKKMIDIFYLLSLESNESSDEDELSSDEDELSSSELEKIRRFFCLDVIDRFFSFLILL
jgi:hypothetical protein